MAERIIMSEKFDAGAMAAILTEFYKTIGDVKIKPLSQHIAGAITFRDALEVRLVIQYEIQTDTHTARFSALIEIPDAD